MRDQVFATDTHPLVWYLSKKESKLPKKVLTAFKSAQEGSGMHIWVPAATAWELSQLMRKTTRISTLGSYEELLRENFFFKSMTFVELEVEDLLIAHGLAFNRDPFDSLIVATAKRLDVPLMTADSDITESNECSVFWA